MAKIKDSIAILIGKNPSNSPFAYNNDVAGATTIAAPNDSLAGLLIKDGSFSFSQQILSGPGRPDLYTGSAKGALTTTVGPPVCSFSVDLKGAGRVVPDPPTKAAIDFSYGVRQLLEGAGFTWGGSTYSSWLSSMVPYNAVGSTEENRVRYKTIKIWVGDDDGGPGLAYVLGGVFFDLDFNFTPGESATIDVTVYASEMSVLTDIGPAEFPTVVDYGTQATVSAPVLENANAKWTTTTQDIPMVYTHGFSDCTISVKQQVFEGYDSNTYSHTGINGIGGALPPEVQASFYASRGITRVVGPHPVITMDGNWYSESGTSTGGGATGGDVGARWFEERALRRFRDSPNLFSVQFNIGINSVVGGIANAVEVQLANFAMESYEVSPQAGVLSYTVSGRCVGAATGPAYYAPLFLSAR